MSRFVGFDRRATRAAGSRLLLGVLLGLGVGALPLACGSDTVREPVTGSIGGAAADAGGGAGGLGLNVAPDTEVDPTLGGPCEDDGQCDDGVACTVDVCDPDLGRCRHTPDDGACEDDGIYCNGTDRCDIRDGCVAGDVVSCSDNSTCTIDVCVEETQSCRHDPRDADGDGDPTRNCGGQDCDDDNPNVSSKATEICGNGRDDNCNGAIDEAGCVAPAHDTCKTALEVTTDGYYDIDLTATKLDYPTECATEKDGYRDAVMRLVVPSGGPFDVDVTAKVDSGNVSLGTAAACGDLSSATCAPPFEALLGGTVARVILRGSGAGTYPIYVAADAEGTARVRVEMRPAEPQAGERCEDAVPLEAGAAPVRVRLPGYAKDATSVCKPLTGDAFVTFTLETPSDVTLSAEAQGGLGLPILALLDADCRSERSCRRSQPARLFARNLAAGTYRVLVAGTAPDDIDVRLDTSPASSSPPGGACAAPLALEDGVEQVVDLSNYEDAVYPKCLVGAPDVTVGFELAGKRDVALVARLSDGDDGAVSFVNDTCTANSACRTGQGIVRTVRYGVLAGSYRGVVESARGNPVGVSWFERPAVAEVHVPFADDCSSLVKIPETGGRFTGNTSNAFPDFVAGCDVGGQPDGGAPDQMLELDLTEPRRVILDMQGSAYQTMLAVRAGDACPGEELPMACAPGYPATRSYLDLNLPAGHYFVQIDGFGGQSGAWKLDVFTAPR